MGKITLFELHTHGDIQLGPGSMGPAIGADDEEDEQTVVEVEDDGGAPVPAKGAAVLIALGVLVAIAAAVRTLKGETEEEPIDLAESDQL